MEPKYRQNYFHRHGLCPCGSQTLYKDCCIHLDSPETMKGKVFLDDMTRRKRSGFFSEEIEGGNIRPAEDNPWNVADVLFYMASMIMETFNDPRDRAASLQLAATAWLFSALSPKAREKQLEAYFDDGEPETEDKAYIREKLLSLMHFKDKHCAYMSDCLLVNYRVLDHKKTWKLQVCYTFRQPDKNRPKGYMPVKNAENFSMQQSYYPVAANDRSDMTEEECPSPVLFDEMFNMTDIILKLASGPLKEFGHTRAHQEQWIRVACAAWNISFEPRDVQKRDITEFVKGIQKEDKELVRLVLMRIIKVKHKMYGHIDCYIEGFDFVDQGQGCWGLAVKHSEIMPVD